MDKLFTINNWSLLSILLTDSGEWFMLSTENNQKLVKSYYILSAALNWDWM